MFKYFNLQWIHYTRLHSHVHLFSSLQLSQIMSLITILSYDIYTVSCHCQVSFAFYRRVVTYIEEQSVVVLLGKYKISIPIGEIIKVLSLSLSLSLWLWWVVELRQAGGLHGVISWFYLILGVLTLLCNTGWFLLSFFYLINSF